MRFPVLGGWREDPLCSYVYPWLVEHDRVVSFTGLHCFPDPHRAAAEMVRVLTPAGVVSGSTLLSDTGPRYAPLRWGGTAAGILGPMCTSRELRDWLREAGCGEVSLEVEGAVGWFRATKGDRG